MGPPVLALSSNNNRLLWLTPNNPVIESKREFRTLANRKALLDDICKQQMDQRSADLASIHISGERSGLRNLGRARHVGIAWHRMQVHDVRDYGVCVASAKQEVGIVSSGILLDPIKKIGGAPTSFIAPVSTLPRWA